MLPPRGPICLRCLLLPMCPSQRLRPWSHSTPGAQLGAAFRGLVRRSSLWAHLACCAETRCIPWGPEQRCQPAPADVLVAEPQPVRLCGQRGASPQEPRPAARAAATGHVDPGTMGARRALSSQRPARSSRPGCYQLIACSTCSLPFRHLALRAQIHVLCELRPHCRQPWPAAHHAEGMRDPLWC